MFQVLRRHFPRYTPEMVEETCGIPARPAHKVAEALCRNSGRERTSAFCYAVGWTQHTVGVQYIRTACIIQLLLGQHGRPGGGILALRGHASIQGSTDIPTLYNLLPGYLPMPRAKHDTDFETYNELNESPSGWWGEFPQVFGLSAQGLVRRSRPTGERLLLQASSGDDRRPLAHEHGGRHGGRRGEGLLRDGRESGGRHRERAAPARGIAASWNGWWCAIFN